MLDWNCFPCFPILTCIWTIIWTHTKVTNPVTGPSEFQIEVHNMYVANQTNSITLSMNSYFDANFKPNLWRVKMPVPKLSLTLVFNFFPASMKILLVKNKTQSGSVKKLVLAYLCLLYIMNSGDTETNPVPDMRGRVWLELVCSPVWLVRQMVSCWLHVHEYTSVHSLARFWYRGLSWIASLSFSSRSTLLSNGFNTLSSISSEDDIKSPIATSSPIHVSNCSS